MTEQHYPPLKANPAHSPIYASNMIQERRKRILVETRRMIADGGLEKFSIRTLCQNADVAQRTLYNAFQSKDRLIAIAIRETYEDVNRNIQYRTPVDTIDGIIDRLISINSRNFKARNYTKAVTTLYFSSTISKDVWVALREMAFLNLRRWLDRLARDGSLVHWVTAEQAAADIANIEYAIINDWASERLSDEDYLPRLAIAVLSHAAGVTTGSERARALEMATEIATTKRLPQFPKPVFRQQASSRPRG